MTERDDVVLSPAIDSLGYEFERLEGAARSRRRRWAIVLAALSLAGAPAAAIAVTSDDDRDDTESVPAPGSPEAIESGGTSQPPVTTVPADRK